MLIYIDDSGDGGFKVGRGSSSHLVFAACVFDDPKQMELLAEAVAQCKAKNRRANEFKYSSAKDRHKDCFFDCIEHVQFAIRAIVIDKAVIYSPFLRSSPKAMKSYAIRLLLSKSFGTFNQAKVFIDGQDTKAFTRSDPDYLMDLANRENPNSISAVRMVDSKASVGIQLADMVAGSIYAKVRTDKIPSSVHFDRLYSRMWQPKGSFWMLK